MASKTQIVLLRGLNTYGDDNLRFGLLNLGDFYQHISKELEAKGLTVFCVRNMGFESLEAMTERAVYQIKEKLPPQDSLVLVGQSTGGLIARMLAHNSDLKPRIKAVYTMGTPHRGFFGAEKILDWTDSKPLLVGGLRLFNYNLNLKKDIIRQFTEESLQQFNSSYPDLYGIPYGSFICNTDKDQWSLPFRVLDRVLPKHSKDHDTSDGLIHVESQKWGQEIANLALDHIGTMGFFLQPKKEHKNAARREFNRLLDRIHLSIRDIM